MGLTFSWLKPKKYADRQLLSRLRVELDVDELADSFDLLAERYHKARLKIESKRFNHRRQKYEALLEKDPKEVLREALRGEGGLEHVVQTFSKPEIEKLREDLKIQGLQKKDIPPEEKVMDVSKGHSNVFA